MVLDKCALKLAVSEQISMGRVNKPALHGLGRTLKEVLQSLERKIANRPKQKKTMGKHEKSWLQQRMTWNLNILGGVNDLFLIRKVYH